MEKLKAKLKKQGGFTMVELLIVVAIIAILVAVSIPMFNNALEGSRHAVDQANVRDAIILANAEYLADSDAAETFKGDGVTYNYVVGDETDTGHQHQGYLENSATTGAHDAVDPACTCGTGSRDIGLTVTVKAPGTGDNGMPNITTNWTISDGKTNTGS